MLYVQLDVNWVDNPSVMEVGLEGAGLHAMALCMAKRMETDGVLHRTHLLRVGGTEELIDRLIQAELLDALDGRRVYVHGWLDRNPSQAEIANHRSAIAATRTARSASGREGNHRRWGHPGPIEECPKCNPGEHPESDPKQSKMTWSVAGASRNGSHSDSQGDRKLSLETETETETETEGGVRGGGDGPPTLSLVVESVPSPPAPDFEDFWREYPRKAGKGQARRAWAAAVKHHDPAAIVDGASRLAADPNLPTGADKNFIKHPATWIRAEGWTDEPLPKRPVQRDPHKPTGTETGGQYAPAEFS